MFRLRRRSPVAVLVVLFVSLVAWVMTKTEREADTEPRTPSGDSVVVKVDRIVDGDTARVWFGDRSESVRYIGIDTPEMNPETNQPACYARQATDRNRQLIERSPEVRLVFDRERRDRYGRLLAYVYSGPTLLQADLLEGGYAKTLEVPPNTSRADHFTSLEAQARQAGRGLWSEC